jgi:hypothetical protein
MGVEPLVLINAFEVPAEETERFLAAREAARDYLQSAGYVDTAPHESVVPGVDFQSVNVGLWESADHFQAATQTPGFHKSASGMAAYRPHPGLYRVVRT